MSALDPLHREGGHSASAHTHAQPVQTTTSRAYSGGGGYEAQVQRLTPRETMSGVTIAGVTLTTQASGATFAALEGKLGNAWARSARSAAKRGGDAVLELFAPHLSATLLKHPAAHTIADAYAAWALTQPPIDAPKKDDKGDEKTSKKHDIDVGDYGLMVPLQAAIGAQLALLCPTVGRSAAAHVKGSCSVEEVFMSLGLELDAARSADGFEVGGAVTISIGLGTTKENIAINEKLSVKGHGDDAIESMHMAGLAIEHFMREQQFDWKNPSWDEVMTTGKKFLVNSAVMGGGCAGVAAAGTLALAGAKIADVLWGKRYEEDLALQMDEDDYGEHSVQVGVGVSADESDVGMHAGFDYTHATKVKNVNGAIGSESEDELEGNFSVKFEAGGWEVELGGHIGGTFGGSTKAGFSVALGRKDGSVSDGALLADMLGAEVRGLAHRISARATGFIGKVADGMDLLLRGWSAAQALGGTGGLEISGDYDSHDKVLALKLTVTKELEAEANEGVVAVDVAFSLGEEVAHLDIPIDPP